MTKKSKGRNLSKEAFIKALSIESALPEDVVQNVLHGMVRLVTNSLRDEGRIKVPHFGRLAVSLPIIRKFPNVNTGEIMHGRHYKITFKIDKDLKEYINAVYTARERRD